MQWLKLQKHGLNITYTYKLYDVHERGRNYGCSWVGLIEHNPQPTKFWVGWVEYCRVGFGLMLGFSNAK